MRTAVGLESKGQHPPTPHPQKGKWLHLLWCAFGNVVCLFITSAMEATVVKNSLNRALTLHRNMGKTLMCVRACVCLRVVSFIYFHYQHFLLTHWACLHGPVTSPPSTKRERDGLCGKEGWRLGHCKISHSIGLFMRVLLTARKVHAQYKVTWSKKPNINI